MYYYVDEANGKTVRSSDDVIIADFYVKLIRVNEYMQNNVVIQKEYVLQFYNPAYVCEAEIDVKNLEKFDYCSICDSLLLSPTISTAGKEMAYYIKKLSKGIVPNRICLFNKLGWHNFSGQHYYCAGDIIIGNCTDEFKIASDISEKYKFEYDDFMSEKKCVDEISNILNIEKHISSIVFVTGMLGVLRQLFKDADVRVPCCLYVYGATQSRKTTLVNFCTALYNRSTLRDLSGISTLRVSSTEFKCEECLDALKDATFVFDDLYDEADKRLRREYEKRVRNIIRNFADNSPRTTSRSAFENNCQVIITAEYPLNMTTDVGRLMELQVSEPINSERLAACQTHELSVSTFYYHFIKWVSGRYDAIVTEIRNQFKAFRLTSYTHNSKYERLYEQSFLLNYAFELLLKYAAEVGYDMYNKKAVVETFLNYIKAVLAEQEANIKKNQLQQTKTINFSSEVLEMLNKKIITIGEKGDECFKKNDNLYITNKAFGICLKNKFGRTFSAKEVTAYFRNRYISESYADNRLKKYNNKCYLILNINELIKDSKDDSHNINNLFLK